MLGMLRYLMTARLLETQQRTQSACFAQLVFLVYGATLDVKSENDVGDKAFSHVSAVSAAVFMQSRRMQSLYKAAHLLFPQ
jgi:hypothetical protein